MKTPKNRRAWILLAASGTLCLLFAARGRTTPRTPADDIVSLVAQANRRYAADHGRVFVRGWINNACNVISACPGLGPSDPCNLVACGYLKPQDWDAQPIRVAACDGPISPAWAVPRGGDDRLPGIPRADCASHG